MAKVLVVEDDALNTELVLEILNEMGFTAHGAVDGEEAIKKSEKEFYDLIIMDIMLPGMDGIETTRVIKSMPDYKDVPIIALTALAMKGDKERLLNAGFDCYIPKPIDVHDFRKRMEKYTRRICCATVGEHGVN